MNLKRLSRWLMLSASLTAFAVMFFTPGPSVEAHKVKHTAEDLNTFNEVFMEEVKFGDALYHGDPKAAKKARVTLSKTGMACAMCHPFGSDIHPYEFPKFQEQMAKFATLRDMINWCIEKPNQGVRIKSDSRAMKALEAYMYWSARGSALDPGRH